MAYRLMEERGTPSYGVVSYIVDNVSDISNLPVDHQPGSTALVASTSDVYILNNQEAWVLLELGGGENELPPVASGDNGKILKVINGNWGVGVDEEGVTDVTVDGSSVVTDGIAEIDLSGKQDVLIAGTNINIASDGKTISATIPTVPVTDVQLNNSSIVSNGVANIPVASLNVLGVVKTNSDLGISITNGELKIVPSTQAMCEAGDDAYRPIVPKYQYASTFYGLEKASRTSGLTYTAQQKQAIQQMIGILSVEGVGF